MGNVAEEDIDAKDEGGRVERNAASARGLPQAHTLHPVTNGHRETVPITSLLPADTPRTEGIDQEHVRRLAEVGSGLPPILVQRSSRRVIDGTHRLQAAIQRGDEHVVVRYFDGGDFESFVHAVRVNVAHGLPLSARERETAAERILMASPEWSDRSVAELAGLSAPTVAAIRRRSTDKSFQSSMRLGRDGRARPVDGAEGRRRATEIILSRPEASLREIAREAGVSVGTAHNVRVKLRASQEKDATRELSSGRPETTPVPSEEEGSTDRDETEPRDHRQVLLSLRKDPSLRLTMQGRFLLQSLGILSVDRGRLKQFAYSVPDRWVLAVAGLARGSAVVWQLLAEELERRATML